MSDVTPNNDHSLQNSNSDNEIDFKELFLVLWKGKWLISAVTGLAAAISVTVALMLPNTYTAAALLAPAEQSSGGISALMRQYGGLASLAGVSLPTGEDGSRAQLALHLMRSRAFIGDFVARRDILRELMAVKSWNLISDELTFDEELYDSLTGKWVRDVDPPFVPEPSVLEAHEEFEKILNVYQDKKTGYVTISVDHKSPKIAAQWVNWLVEDVNEAVRSQDVSEAEKSIEYLREQVTNTSLADLQAVFFDLIQSQTETVMLAEVRPEYVFKTIDPAVAPEEKSKPNRALICVLGTLLGGVLGAAIAFIRQHIRPNTSE
jgi:uncharacterized protein involved in exopolysaccharide biosynthesis